MSRFPRGSEWRRWDLHIHTPYSVLNNGFGTDFETYAQRVLEAAHAKQIAAIGITDYFSVAGYRHMKRILQDEVWLGALRPEVAEHARSLLVVANVELRGFVIGGGDNRDSRVNYHILFADDLSADNLEQNFLARLEFTAAAAPFRPDERWALTEANLEAIGARLKAEHEGFTQSPLSVGMMNAVVDHAEATKLLFEQPSRFEGKYLLVCPIDEDLADLSWDGQGHLTRKLFVQKSHMLFSANPGTRAFALGRKHDSVDAYVREFVSIKPCIHGSDAHDFDALFEPAERRYSWIKADPTWRGLAMLLNEPEERTYIGLRPPQLEALQSRTAKTIGNASVHRVATATTTEQWFDNTVPLNDGTCAIIGNRGNGKSALAEIVALLGDTKRVASFSFLTPERFRSPRIGKASQFEATISWRDGTTQGPRRLSEDPLPAAVERVRYIGQGFLEEVCNEIDRGESSRFYKELQHVIFSHVPQSERQEHSSLSALLTELGEGIGQSIAVLQEDLRALNRKFLDVSQRLQPEYREQLDAQLEEANRQLAALDAAKPVEVQAPAEAQVGRQAELRQQLAALHDQVRQADEELASAAREDAEQVARRAAATRLLERVRALETAVRGFRDESHQDAQFLGIDVAAIAELRVNTGPLDEVIRQVAERRAALLVDLNPEQDGIARRRESTVQQIAEIQEQLSIPERLYQEYLATFAQWQTNRAAIVGSRAIASSIEGLQAQITSLETVREEQITLNQRRRAKVTAIYDAKSRLKQHYEDLHRPVSRFLETSDVAASDAFKLRFSAAIVEEGFADRLLAMIDQRRAGPFAGVEDGRKKIEDLLREVDWTSAEQVPQFPELVESMLGGEARSPALLAEQLRQGFVAEDLLDLVFGLDYVFPTYRLTWDGRAVSELSPGERGNLLLIFYLLVDRNDIPLIIDQPEENLDNQTVFKTLVPCMRDARGRRQVIVVTHNPNLAVVCDAEQVIYAEILKDGSNRVIYEAGAIEDPAINQRLLDVLEGTKPAFSARAAKYLLPLAG